MSTRQKIFLVAMICLLLPTYAFSETLILFYSKSGKNEIVANALKEILPNSTIVRVKGEFSIPLGIIWYKLPFTKCAYEPINVDFAKFDKVILCTPVYLQGISPPISAVIDDIPLKGKKVSVFATCGGFYGSWMHWFVKRSIRASGGEINEVNVVKVGGKTDEEIKAQLKNPF
jgi:flavodoxin